MSPTTDRKEAEDMTTFEMLRFWIASRLAEVHRDPERGATTVETVIITAAVAAMAIAALAAISLLVDAKVAGISL